MKLNINFMIKDGKRIISKSTVGYKVLLNRVSLEFIKNKKQTVVKVDVIIQTSKNSADNNNGLNYRRRGICYLKKAKIIVWTHNCENNHQQVLAVLAHEFGHMLDYSKDSKLFWKLSNRTQEIFADNFSFKVTRIEKSASITGKVRSIAAMNRSRK